jgi:hypothetical protein
MDCVGVGAVEMMGGDASPFDLPERVALDARASRARRVGASVALVIYDDSFLSHRLWDGSGVEK